MENSTESRKRKTFKILIIGDSHVGKTSICRQYVKNIFSFDLKLTFGVENFVKTITFQNEKMTFVLWDIAGQETYRKLSRSYYKDAEFCFVVFNISNRHSFENIYLWKKDVDLKVLRDDGKPVPSILLANKSDVPDAEVTDLEIEQAVRDLGFLASFKVSARLNSEIDLAMERMAVYLLSVSRGRSVSARDNNSRTKVPYKHVLTDTDFPITSGRFC